MLNHCAILAPRLRPESSERLPVATANAVPAPAIASLVLLTPKGVPEAAVIMPLHCQPPIAAAAQRAPITAFGVGRLQTYEPVNTCVRSLSEGPRVMRQ